MNFKGPVADCDDFMSADRVSRASRASENQCKKGFVVDNLLDRREIAVTYYALISLDTVNAP